LAGCGVEDEGTLALVETILRNHPRTTHLALDENVFGHVHEAAMSFLKTAIHHSSLTRLDCKNCHLEDEVFENLASWKSLPPDQKISTLQKLRLSGNALTDDEGMQHLATVLQLHTPHLQSLCLTDHCFSLDGAMHLAKSLQSISLVELCLKDCALNVPILQVFWKMLPNLSTLKIFRMDPMELHVSDFECTISILTETIQMLTETVGICQLHTLHLHFIVDEDVDEDKIDSYQVALLHAFAANLTLTDVSLSYNILRSQHQAKLFSLCARNSGFQKITSRLVAPETDTTNYSDDEDEEFDVVDDRDELSTCSGVNSINGDNDNAISLIPLGFWAHVLEAVHKQFPDVSTLHELLSSRIGDLLDGREERNFSPSSTTTTTRIHECHNTKRDYSQISE
jgi:Ran GTPase-activating protein (RanGAP) involved in mRNA processing and transport